MMASYFLLVLLTVVPFEGTISGNGHYIRTDNITLSSWNTAIFKATGIGMNMVECASLCQQFHEFEMGTCNSFAFDNDNYKCSLTKLTFLEDHKPNMQSKTFYTDVEALESLKLYCFGGNHCCRPENQCSRNEGDCNTWSAKQ